MSQKKFQKFLTVSLILMLSACNSIKTSRTVGNLLQPTPMFLGNLPKEDNNYSMGFNDGCYNFIGQNGNGMLRFYEVPVREDITFNDPHYQQGYTDGDRYCGVYVNNEIIL